MSETHHLPEPEAHGHGGPGLSYAASLQPTQRRSYTIAVNPEVARAIKGPGLGLNEFFHEVRQRREALDRDQGVATQRNKDVFLKDLVIRLGGVAQTFTDYRDQLADGHRATVKALVELAAEAARFAEWDARAGRP